MTTWSRAVCEANGIRVHYLRTGGGGRPVVLLHGLMGSGACWTPVARAMLSYSRSPALADRALLSHSPLDDFDLIMPDARGHGDSSAPLHGYRYDDSASDVVGLIRALGLSRPVLLGHSMGGMTAALVASRGEGLLRGLVLVDPTFLSPERQREVQESDVADQHRRALGLPRSELVAEARARHAATPGHPSLGRSPEIIELQVDARLKTRMPAFDVLTPPSPDYREVVRAIDVPSLLVTGDRSPVVTPEMAAELSRLNPRFSVEQIPGAGHGLPFEQPERLGECVVSFLRTVEM